MFREYHGFTDLLQAGTVTELVAGRQSLSDSQTERRANLVLTGMS
jgi:hypothetical protein